MTPISVASKCRNFACSEELANWHSGAFRVKIHSAKFECDIQPGNSFMGKIYITDLDKLRVLWRLSAFGREQTLRSVGFFGRARFAW